MSLIVYHPKKTTAHSTTAAYVLARIHWYNPVPGDSASIVDGAGNLVASLTDKSPDVVFNPTKSVTGLRVIGAASGFLHIYSQEASAFAA